jgi:GNAT superfamily N-acetyltransferase
MTAHALDNPVWAALRSHHSHFAVVEDSAGRYPAEVAPFVAVGSVGSRATEQLARLVNPGESVYVVGLVPELGAGWTVHSTGGCPQMVCRSPSTVKPGPEWTVLSEAHRADMLALTALVFPGFFRARTLEMGQYLGIYCGKVLVAMAGERMRLDGYREISAVCTHPEFLGRGYAQRLVAQLSNACLERGVTPFLHVHRDNVRAMSVYERLGYAYRADVMLCSVTRREKT